MNGGFFSRIESDKSLRMRTEIGRAISQTENLLNMRLPISNHGPVASRAEGNGADVDRTTVD